MELSEQMRNVPQIMRHYIILNNLRSVSIDSLMDHCSTYPLLQKIKRILLHDKKRAISEIEYYINELSNNRFHFLYRLKGYENDKMMVWPEDLANSKWDKREMIIVLKDLRDWVEQQETYVYPAEIDVDTF